MKKFCSEKRERVKSAEKSGLTEATKGDKITQQNTQQKDTGNDDWEGNWAGLD